MFEKCWQSDFSRLESGACRRQRVLGCVQAAAAAAARTWRSQCGMCSFFEAPVHYGWHPVTHIPPNELNVWLPLCADCFSARQEVRVIFFFQYFLLFPLSAAQNRIGTCIFFLLFLFAAVASFANKASDEKRLMTQVGLASLSTLMAPETRKQPHYHRKNRTQWQQRWDLLWKAVGLGAARL